MAGNRAREEAFQIPLLFELATMREDPPESGRCGPRKSHDLEYVRDNVLGLFDFTPEQRQRTRPKKTTGKPYKVLDNEVDYAFDELENNQEVTRQDRHWEITDKGLERLRKHIHGLLRTATEEEWEAVLSSTGSNGNEQLLCLLRCLDQDDLVRVINAASTSRELFLVAFNSIPSDRLGPILFIMDQEILSIVARVLTRQYADELALV